MSGWPPYAGLCAGGPLNGQSIGKTSKKFGVMFQRSANQIPELDYYIWNEPSMMFIWSGPNNVIPIKKED